MTGRRALALIVVLASLSMLGIISLLLTERGAALFLLMAAAPLLLGLGCYELHRKRQ